MMRVALLVAALALAAHAQSASKCKARVDAFVFDVDDYTATQAKEACVADD
jgi:hypothetical protein